MKRILLGAALTLFVAGTASAAIDTDKGSQSLMFTFSGLSNLGAGGYDPGTTPSIPTAEGSVSVGGIGVRHFMNNGMAIRPGVTLAFLSDKTEQGGGEVENSGFALGVNAVLEKFMAQPTSRVAPYLGVGAGFGIANGSQKFAQNNQDVEDKGSAFGFGAFGVFGFVAEIFDGVELGAEYQGGVRLESGTIEEEGAEDVDVSSFDFGIGTASFYMSVDLN